MILTGVYYLSAVRLQALLILLILKVQDNIYLAAKTYNWAFRRFFRGGRDVFDPKIALRVATEVGNVTLKCNAITCYCLCHVLRALTFSSDNYSNLNRAITLRH